MHSKSSARPLRFVLRVGLLLAASQPALVTPALAVYFQQRNLVTDSQQALTSLGFAPASHVDPNLINPWGASFGPGGPFWVSNQGSNTSTLYDGNGAALPLVVNIPHGEGQPIGPTGQVFAAGQGFDLPDGSGGVFFFANLDGSISGWNPAAGTTALITTGGNAGPDRPGILTGLTLGSVGDSNYLYAANHLTGRIDVYDSSFAPVTLAGDFSDPGANSDGLLPFNIRNVGGRMFVTYAQAGADADEAPLGSGFVSEFNADGTFIRRFATGGPLASPWGVALAPEKFGPFGGALLVGNFSEDHGTINAFSLADGSFLGALAGANGDPILIPHLWEILAGNGALNADPSALYFAAGIGDEQHGLFGNLSAVPEPAQWLMMVAGFGLIGLAHRRRRRTARQTLG